MFWLKACPRCGGDLQAADVLLDHNPGGLAREYQLVTVVRCFQCGHELSSPPAREAVSDAA